SAHPFSGSAGPSDFTATLVHRPASAASVARAGTACASLGSLPPIEQVMPTKTYKQRIFDIGESAVGAADLAFASTNVQDPHHSQVLTAAGMVKLDYQFKTTMDENTAAVNHYCGYVEALRHLQKKKNLQVQALVALIAEHGTPELKAGIDGMAAWIKAEEAKLDEAWMRKKRGTDWPGLPDEEL
ncbi:hypothetical protein C8A01DRAFT_18514, partial [Parachaetomium inaequale]